MSADAAEYLQFESEVAAALTEVLAKDGHYDYEFTRKKKPHGVEWALTGDTGGLPFVSLLLIETGRETQITLLLADGGRFSEVLKGRWPKDIGPALDKLRANAGLPPLFDASRPSTP